jgi:hypothetical protein
MGKKHYRWLNDIFKLSHGAIPIAIPDSQKTWDPRWATLFIDKNTIYASQCIYDSDIEAWNQLLDAALAENGDYISEARHGKIDDDGTTLFNDALLVRAFAIKHPQAEAHYKKWIAAGYPKALLDKLIARG